MKKSAIQTIITNINVTDNLKQSKRREMAKHGNFKNSTEKCIVMSTIEMLKKEAERLDR